MATIIHHTPGSNADTSDSFLDIILGIILLLVIVGIFFFYALPAIERKNNAALPQNDSVDVNVQLRGGEVVPAAPASTMDTPAAPTPAN